jgi:hypothetical protein
MTPLRTTILGTDAEARRVVVACSCASVVRVLIL